MADSADAIEKICRRDGHISERHWRIQRVYLAAGAIEPSWSRRTASVSQFGERIEVDGRGRLGLVRKQTPHHGKKTAENPAMNTKIGYPKVSLVTLYMALPGRGIRLPKSGKRKTDGAI